MTTFNANDWIIEQIGDQMTSSKGYDGLIHLIPRVTNLSVETMHIIDNLSPTLEG